MTRYFAYLWLIIMSANAYTDFLKIKSFKTKDSEGRTLEVEFRRLHSPKNAAEDAEIKTLKEGFIRDYIDGHRYLGLSSGVTEESAVIIVGQLFESSLQNLREKDPNSFFMFELASVQGPLGSISVDRSKNLETTADEIYLYHFYTKFRGQGLGRWTLRAVLEFLPNTKAVRLVVRPDHWKTVAAYRTWGFEPDAAVKDPLHPQCMGMTLTEEKLAKFLLPLEN